MYLKRINPIFTAKIYKLINHINNGVLAVAIMLTGYQSNYTPTTATATVLDKVPMSEVGTKTPIRLAYGLEIENLAASPIFPTDPIWYKKEREYRAEIVYNTLSKSGGWWGEGTPTEIELVAWLVFEEGSTLSEYDKLNMAKGIRYRFHYLTYNSSFIQQLSAYTAFFNPDGDLTLDTDDWDCLINPKVDMNYYVGLVEKAYSVPIEHRDGNYLYWWSESEVNYGDNSPGEINKDYFKTRTNDGKAFYFSGIPNVRDCFTRGVNCR